MGYLHFMEENSKEAYKYAKKAEGHADLIQKPETDIYIKIRDGFYLGSYWYRLHTHVLTADIVALGCHQHRRGPFLQALLDRPSPLPVGEQLSFLKKLMDEVKPRNLSERWMRIIPPLTPCYRWALEIEAGKYPPTVVMSPMNRNKLKSSIYDVMDMEWNFYLPLMVISYGDLMMSVMKTKRSYDDRKVNLDEARRWYSWAEEAASQYGFDRLARLAQQRLVS